MLKFAGINIPPKIVTEVHRVGPKIPGQIRAMMVTLSYIEDFPKQINNNRKELKPILIAANKKNTEGDTRYKAALKGDSLHINNNKYTVKNMNEVPNELRHEKIATPSRDGLTAFFTKYSPLSNHHLAPQTIGNKTYNCNEQYLMEQKALVFGNSEMAKRIMIEKDPKVQKKIANKYNIKNFSEKAWNERNLDIMETGICAKFSQNEHLKQFILCTKPNLLVEASPNDRYWGVGKSLQNPNLWNRNSWLNNSKNYLGCILMKVRKELDPFTAVLPILT